MSRELRFVIRADSKVGQAIDRTRGMFAGLRDSVRGMFSGMGAWFGIDAVSRATGYVRSLASEMGDIADSADALGMATGAFQALSIEAKNAGLEAGALFQNLARLKDTSATLEGTSVEAAFLRLGISIREVRELAPERLLELISSRLAQTGDESAAFDIFGARGTRLIQVLRNIGGSMDNLIQKHSLEIVDDETLRKMDEVDETLQSVDRTIKSWAAGGVQKAADAFAGLGEAWAKLTSMRGAPGANQADTDAAVEAGRKAHEARVKAGLARGREAAGQGVALSPADVASPEFQAEFEASRMALDEARMTTEGKLANIRRQIAMKTASMNADDLLTANQRLRIQTEINALKLRELDIQKEIDTKAAHAAVENAMGHQDAAQRGLTEQERNVETWNERVDRSLAEFRDKDVMKARLRSERDAERELKTISRLADEYRERAAKGVKMSELSVYARAYRAEQDMLQRDYEKQTLEGMRDHLAGIRTNLDELLRMKES